MYKSLAKTSIVGKKVIFMPSCHSTNDICAEFLAAGQGENGLVIATDYQTDGRGQGTNLWISDKGENLIISILLDTSFLAVSEQFYLNMVVCISILEVLKNYLGENVKIKWPNDIYYNDKKICGVLIQNNLKGTSMEYSIVGIGINVNQTVFSPGNAASLRMITGKWYELQNVFEQTGEKLEKYYLLLKDGNNKSLKRHYMKNLMWYQEAHNFTFKSDKVFKGIITDVEESGRLIIKSGDVIHRFGYQEIRFVR